MDRNTCNRISADVQAALVGVASKYNIKFISRGGTFTASSFVLKIEAVEISDSPSGKEADAFKKLATFYGFKKTDLGRSVKLNGSMFKIIGLKPAASRRPILLEDSNSKRVVCSADYVRSQLAA